MVRCSSVVCSLVAIIAALPLILAVAFPLLDTYASSVHPSGRFFVGFTPMSHRGKPHGFSFNDIPDLTGKVAVVTGANGGLGYWTTLHLARKGAQVVMTCRSLKKCDAAVQSIKANHSAALLEPMQLDLGSLKSVRQFAAAFLKKHSRIDTLVMNAGVMVPNLEHTIDGLEQHFGVNHVAHQLLGSLLEPTLGEKSTVTVVSSAYQYLVTLPAGVPLSVKQAEGVAEGFAGDEVYAQSKLANVLYAQELSDRLAAKGVRVNSCHPGAVWTDIFKNVYDEIRNRLGDAVGGAVSKLVASAIHFIAWDAEVASLTQLYLAVSPAVVDGGITGKYFHPIARELPPNLKFCNDKAKQKALWEFTEDLIKARSPVQ
eukprot:Hpha_TRINITY_DN12282_c0_g2::TRINITY_DN12282_c0_g2_i1::g.16672::m.16672